jgi:hypothetical protein
MGIQPLTQLRRHEILTGCFCMENLIETLKNTVAFLMVMRIAVLIGLILILLRLGYSLLNSSEMKRFWNDSKRIFTRFKKDMGLN